MWGKQSSETQAVLPEGPFCGPVWDMTWNCALLLSHRTSPSSSPPSQLPLLHGRGCKSCFYQKVRLLNHSVSLSEEHPAVCILHSALSAHTHFFSTQYPWRVKWWLITTKEEHSPFITRPQGLTLWCCLQTRLTRQQGQQSLSLWAGLWFEKFWLLYLENSFVFWECHGHVGQCRPLEILKPQFSRKIYLINEVEKHTFRDRYHILTDIKPCGQKIYLPF